ncbi:hypothetical protein HanPI659440_Chr15g0605661 [Helianthus annuus]|nr:hypothetical protein HanPI659440_Chr15g0605661 [Helianthus annuus]
MGPLEINHNSIFCNCFVLSFKNCELRSMVIVDRSMIRSDTSKTNFLGKTANGTDVASDAV